MEKRHGLTQGPGPSHPRQSDSGGDAHRVAVERRTNAEKFYQAAAEIEADYLEGYISQAVAEARLSQAWTEAIGERKRSGARIHGEDPPDAQKVGNHCIRWAAFCRKSGASQIRSWLSRYLE